MAHPLVAALCRRPLSPHLSLPVSQLRGSARLRVVLAAALAAGNALNTGTSHGGAQGFTIATLLKLANLRVSRRPFTLLASTAGDAFLQGTPFSCRSNSGYRIPQHARAAGLCLNVCAGEVLNCHSNLD